MSGPDEPLVEPIAIVGLSARVPGAGSAAEFWRNLAGGVESVSFFSLEEQAARGVSPASLDDPAFVPASPVLDDVEFFDAGFFGMTPREAELRDPQQRLFLELAQTALEDAGYDPTRYAGEIGVYGGIGPDEYQWRNIRRNPAVLASAGMLAVATGNHSDYLSTFTSYKLNLRGPSLTVHTACSTSLVAVHLACEALRNRECDMALAGASAIELPHGHGYLYYEGGIMSPDGHCRAFDASSGGTLWGSGGGVVVLKRLAEALADGDPVRAVVLGNAINNDGADKVGFSAPSVEGQAAVVAQALGVAGVDPRTVSYVEAHGTGTALGDPIEIAALSAAFGQGGDRQWCALGSVKTNIGHLGPAAGVAGLVKAVLALEHGVIPPSLHFEAPHPKIDFAASPFYVNATLSTWDTSGAPRRAGISSFGIGGTNAHVLLEQAPPAEPHPAALPGPALLQLSARSPAALAALTGRLADHLADHPGLDLADVAFTLRHGRRVHQHRAVAVAADTADAAVALRTAKRAPTGQADGRPPQVAFLFSGQGAQYGGMGAGLYATEPVFASAVDDCAELLRPHLGRDLRELLLATGDDRGPADAELGRTALTQPALFTVEYALAALWRSWGVEPAAMIGHSIGEYVAATLAGVFTLPDALALVARRGALMQSMPPGSMLAVQSGVDEVRAGLPDGLAVATVNGPGTCVVAGPAEAVDAYAVALREQGIGSKRLRTSHAFHSAMMEPILAPFRDEVATVPRQAPTRPFLSNVSGGWITAEQATDPSYWARHLREAVRFGDNLATLLAGGDWALVEVGPGRQLAGLAKLQIPRQGRQPLPSLPGPDGRASDGDVLLAAAGQLWLSGVDVQVGGAEPAGRRVPLPTYPFERKYYWVQPTAPDAATGTADPGPLPVDDWFAVPTWRQVAAPPQPPGAPPIDRCLLFGDGPHATALVGALRATGADVTVVHTTATAGPDAGWWIAPADRAAMDTLVAELAAGPGLPGRIVHALAWDRPAAGIGPDAAWQAQDAGFFSVLALAQALAAAQPAGPIHLDVVTAGTQAVLGDDLRHPEHATVAGPALVLPLELPWLTVRQIDAPAESTDPAAAVAAELLRPPVEGAPIVAVRAGRRWVRDWEPVRVPAPVDPLAGVRTGGVYLITGGLGGIGITVAEDLATRAGAKLVLLARTALPEPSEWDRYVAVHGTADRAGRAIAAVRRMQRAGAEVLVLAADVSDVDDLRRVRDETLRRFGRLDAVIHAAGVPGGGMAEVKERAQAEAVLGPKLRGTLALAEVFGDLPLDAVVLCGSITGIAGGFGQVDYCGGNAFLDAVAQAGAGFAGRVVSLDWGGWLEVGMAAEVAAPDAFRALQRGVVSTPLPHPVLASCHRDPATGTAWCTGIVGPRTHWVLDEHRIAGRAVLPGTGHLASVLAAARAALAEPGAAGPRRPVEFSDVVFVEPMALPDDGQAELRVAFAEGIDGTDFQVTSRSAGTERAHARGTVSHVDGSPAPVHDLAAIQARCTVRTVDAAASTSHSGLLSFGPRWASLRTVQVGVDEELALLEAPDPVGAELDQWELHPALLDEATSFGTSRGGGQYLPMGYGRLLVRAPLPARLWSHLRYRDAGTGEVIVADLTLLDDSGTEVAAISEFVLRRIDADAMRAGLADGAMPATVPATAAAVAGAAAAGDAIGIAPPAGADALRRMLAVDLGRQVAVNAVDIHRTIAAARALTQQTVAAELADAATPRPERAADGDYAGPRTELERSLCAMWQDVLGLDQVGVHDDFFTLGGNSLVAVQLIAHVRKEIGEKLPMRSLFESPTVAGMATAIERLRTTGTGAGDGDGGEPPPITPLPRAGR
jgi:acyl transferase domain-containing protein/acyl carrier protein